jgi:hypothetical protein
MYVGALRLQEHYATECVQPGTFRLTSGRTFAFDLAAWGVNYEFLRLFLGQQLQKQLPLRIGCGLCESPSEDGQVFAAYEFFHSLLLPRGAPVDW